MELKLSKVYVPTNSEFKNGTVGLEFTEKEGYFLTKEELERVIEDAYCDDNSSHFPKEDRRKKALDYISQILK